VVTIQKKYKIGLVLLVNFIFPLHYLILQNNTILYLYFALSLSQLSLLILGSVELETDKRKFKRLKFLRIVCIIVYVYFILTQIGYDFINTLLGFSLPFYLWNPKIISLPNLYWLMLAIIYSHFFVLIIAFVLFGISNRRYYGNYMIAFAVLYFINTMFNLILDATSLFNDTFYLLFMYASLILVSIGASYLVFFGERIRTSYFILSGVMFFGAIFVRWVNSFIFFIESQLEVYALFVLIIALIGIIVSGKFVELGTTFKRGIRVFITHAVDDYRRYRINEIAKFLEGQKGIRYVYYCEADLSGNIDAWMQKTVPRCELLVFMSTEKSLNSNDCVTELNIAREKGLTIIPILGVGLSWADLKKLDVHREVGATFNPMEFEVFCNNLYLQIQKYIKAVDEISETSQLESMQE
jgi:hypothetical protein